MVMNIMCFGQQKNSSVKKNNRIITIIVTCWSTSLSWFIEIMFLRWHVINSWIYAKISNVGHKISCPTLFQPLCFSEIHLCIYLELLVRDDSYSHCYLIHLPNIFWNSQWNWTRVMNKTDTLMFNDWLCMHHPGYRSWNWFVSEQYRV